MRRQRKREDALIFPGEKGFPLNISASIHPTDHTSIDLVYILNESITSGALYHLVATSGGSTRREKVISIQH